MVPHKDDDPCTSSLSVQSMHMKAVRKADPCVVRCSNARSSIVLAAVDCLRWQWMVSVSPSESPTIGVMSCKDGAARSTWART